MIDILSNLNVAVQSMDILNRFDYLYSRYQDEKKYEDKQEYAEALFKPLKIPRSSIKELKLITSLNINIKGAYKSTIGIDITPNEGDLKYIFALKRTKTHASLIFYSQPKTN